LEDKGGDGRKYRYAYQEARLLQAQMNGTGSGVFLMADFGYVRLG
jgi:hypothetical protein